jgi:hypothetical protein
MIRQEDQFMPNIPDTSVTSKPRLPICRICWEPVELETGKTDENSGRPITRNAMTAN